MWPSISTISGSAGTVDHTVGSAVRAVWDAAAASVLCVVSNYGRLSPLDRLCATYNERRVDAVRRLRGHAEECPPPAPRRTRARSMGTMGLELTTRGSTRRNHPAGLDDMGSLGMAGDELAAGRISGSGLSSAARSTSAGTVVPAGTLAGTGLGGVVRAAGLRWVARTGQVTFEIPPRRGRSPGRRLPVRGGVLVAPVGVLRGLFLGS